MFSKRYGLSELGLILVNLLPLYGVWFEGLNPLGVFIIFSLETALLGIVTVVKLALTATFNNAPAGKKMQPQNRLAGGLFIILFFIFHYGFFIFVQTQIFMGVAGIGNGLLHSYRDMFNILGNEGYLLLGLFAIWYALDMITNFIVPGRFRDTPLPVVMFQPYGRIFVQQAIVIAGSMFLSFNLPKIFILVFVTIKLCADLFANKYFAAKPAAMKKAALPRE